MIKILYRSLWTTEKKECDSKFVKCLIQEKTHVVNADMEKLKKEFPEKKINLCQLFTSHGLRKSPDVF
jgi:hypothetical protein